MADEAEATATETTEEQQDIQATGWTAPTPLDEAPKQIQLTSSQLKKRLEESRAAARDKVLKELGFDNLDTAQAKLKTWKELEDSKLSADERRQKMIDELKPKAERVTHLETVLTQLVEQRFTSLTEQAQKAVDAIAQGDPEKRLELMTVMEASGLLGGQKTSEAAGATPIKASVKPASTAPVADAPRSAGAQSMWERFQELERRSPTGAQLFYEANQAAIERDKPAVTGV